jgi:dTDP-4-dehydrorhamnose 3,5-epimerase
VSSEGSSSRGAINEVVVGLHRPALVIVPPRVWHGVQNLRNRPAALLNLPDRAYQYEAPDHWRLPPDTTQIPYTFGGVRAATPGGGSPGDDRDI